MTRTPRDLRPGPHPLHSLLLAFPVALFPAAVLTDIAFLKTSEVQWTNFSAWLISGALVFGGLVGLWAVINLALAARKRRTTPAGILYVAILALMWGLGLVNAFKHSQDGWSSVGTLGLTLSILTALLALVAGWIAFSRARALESL